MIGMVVRDRELFSQSRLSILCTTNVSETISPRLNSDTCDDRHYNVIRTKYTKIWCFLRFSYLSSIRQNFPNGRQKVPKFRIFFEIRREREDEVADVLGIMPVMCR